jgi:hypothetical protein
VLSSSARATSAVACAAADEMLAVACTYAELADLDAVYAPEDTLSVACSYTELADLDAALAAELTLLLATLATEVALLLACWVRSPCTAVEAREEREAEREEA